MSLENDISPGATAYAARQSSIWKGRASSADRNFKTVNADHVSLVL